MPHLTRYVRKLMAEKNPDGTPRYRFVTDPDGKVRIDGRHTKPNRHVVTRSVPRGEWDPLIAKRCPAYPQTPEKFAAVQERSRAQAAARRAEGRFHRMSVQSGWGNRQPEFKAAVARAQERAQAIVRVLMVENDIDPRAQKALEFAVTVFEAKDNDDRPVYRGADRVAAARLVLDFTMAKPAAKQEVKLETAEDFLGALAAKAGV